MAGLCLGVLKKLFASWLAGAKIFLGRMCDFYFHEKWEDVRGGELFYGECPSGKRLGSF